MRVAVYSDVHGNFKALEAVLAVATAGEVDEMWVLGDLVADGPLPAETLRRLMALPNARFVRGNTDRYVVRGDLPPIAPSDPAQWTDADRARVHRNQASASWTRNALGTVPGGLEWLDSLPVEVRPTLPDGTKVLLVHAAPGTDESAGARPSMTDRELLDQRFGDCRAELVFVGHTHLPIDRRVGGVRVVNPGPVGLPFTSERRATWLLLDADKTGYSITPQYTAYDVGAVVAALERVQHPSADRLRGVFVD